MDRMHLVSAVALAAAALAATTAAPAGAVPETATFQAECAGHTLVLETGINSSPLLHVVGAEPRVNAVIVEETAFDPSGTVVFERTVPGFDESEPTTVACVLTTDEAPYAGYVFDVEILFTPVGS